VKAALGESGANAVRDSGEQGFADVRIQLGSGACPCTGLAETTTAKDDSYRFSGLEPGMWGVTLDVMYDSSPNQLSPEAPRTRSGVGSSAHGRSRCATAMPSPGSTLAGNSNT
jgi:hypothetical protein